MPGRILGYMVNLIAEDSGHNFRELVRARFRHLVIPASAFLQIFDLDRKASEPESRNRTCGKTGWILDRKVRLPEITKISGLT